MPRKTSTPCVQPGCQRPAVDRGRCKQHQRPTAARRGYTGQHVTRFRRGVLDRDPTCTTDGCDEPSIVADHHPLTRRQLVQAGLDPDDPSNGRGLCATHHNQHTGNDQPSNPFVV